MEARQQPQDRLSLLGALSKKKQKRVVNLSRFWIVPLRKACPDMLTSG